VEGLGLPRNGLFQVYAPKQNENVYSNEWLGPFYGFERVIETFEFTEKPRRLKPMNIYFHSYITTKRAGMQSLDTVFSYAMAQEANPVFVADYARKVIDFQTLSIARTSKGWRIRGGKNLRTLRLPAVLGYASLDQSPEVAGYQSGAAEHYLHLTSDNVDLVLSSAELKVPRLVSANGKVERYARTSTGGTWSLKGNVPLQWTMANIENCTMRLDGREIRPVRRSGSLLHYELKSNAAGSIQAICQS
jgi:hypothetical protein